MTPKQEYIKLIKKGRARDLSKLKGCRLNGVYGEVHHIVPDCLCKKFGLKKAAALLGLPIPSGKDSPDNLVWLIYNPEHRKAHKLLTLFVEPEGRWRMDQALGMFINPKNGKPFTEAEREESRRASSQALVFRLIGNTPETKGQISILQSKRSIDRQNDLSFKNKMKGPVRILRAYGYEKEVGVGPPTFLLRIIVSANSKTYFRGEYKDPFLTKEAREERRSFGLKSGSHSQWGKKGTWFRLFHHYTDDDCYLTRKEGNVVAKIAILKESPIYQNEIRYPLTFYQLRARKQRYKENHK